MSLEYICGEDTKLKDIKKWLREQVDITISVDSGKYDDESWNQQRIYNDVPIVEYFISLGKYEIADYLMELGAKYDNKMILQAKDIDFIKSHIDITEINNDFYQNSILMNYLSEANLLDGTTIYYSLMKNQNNKNNLEYLHERICKLTTKQLFDILTEYIQICQEVDYELRFAIFKFIIDYLDALGVKRDFKFIDKKVKDWIKYETFAKIGEPKYKFIVGVIHCALDNKFIEQDVESNYKLFCYGLKLQVPISELEFWITRGIDVNYIDENNQNYLFHTTTAEQTKYLLSKGLDANMISLSGTTPLFCLKYKEQVRPLIEAGANPNIKSKKGITAYDVYKKNKVFNYSNQCAVNCSDIADEMLKYLPINEKISNPETKLSDLSVDDLMDILRAKGVNV